jgi:hypothetical protein
LSKPRIDNSKPQKTAPSWFKAALALAFVAWVVSATWNSGDSRALALGMPAGHVQPLMVEEVGDATRLIVSWDKPPSELKIEDVPDKPMSISFSGSMPGLGDLGHVQRFFTWPNLSKVFVENKEGQVRIIVKRTLKGSAIVRAGLNRLIIDVPHDYDRLSSARSIGPGLRHMGVLEKTSGGPVHVHVLEIDPRNPEVEIRPALAVDRLGGKASVSKIVASHQALAGINGSFFKPDTGMPLGILMINQELISGPIYNRVALGIGTDNSLSMAQVRLVGDIAASDGMGHTVKMPVHNVNQPRIRPTETVVYTGRWGAMAPKVPSHGFQIQLRQNRITAISTTTSLEIPKDGLVISGPNTPQMLWLAAQPVGFPVKVGVYTTPDWSNMRQAISGGPWLVRNGYSYIDVTAQHFSTRSLGTREPRTAAGITRSGKLLLVTVDGRRPHVSVGMTLPELSRLMTKLGAVEAMNLDGGSSTQMAINGETVNYPSSGKVGVSNSLLVRRLPGNTGVAVGSSTGHL